MHEAGHRVPLLGLNCIIQGCVNVRDMSRAFQTFDEIQRTFKLEPDVHSYNAILDGCGQARQVRQGSLAGFAGRGSVGKSASRFGSAGSRQSILAKQFRRPQVSDVRYPDFSARTLAPTIRPSNAPERACLSHLP